MWFSEIQFKQQRQYAFSFFSFLFFPVEYGVSAFVACKSVQSLVCLFLFLFSHLWSFIKCSWIFIYSICFRQLHSLFLLVLKLSHLWPKWLCSFGVCDLLTPLFVINEFLGFVAQDISYSIYPAPDLDGCYFICSKNESLYI